MFIFGYVMFVAPLGVFGAMAATVGEKGLRVLVNLGKLVGTLYGAELFFVVVVFGSVATIARIPIRRFISHAKEPFLIAYSNASERSRPAPGARKYGAFRCPAKAHRRLRFADWL